MRIAMLGPFGLHPKATMLRRALPAARALARRGHTVLVIMPPWHTPDEAGRAWPDHVPGVQIEYVSLVGLRTPVLGHAIVAARMARRALALQPEVVHAFKPKAYAGLADGMLHALRPLRAGPRPALVMDTDDWEGPGGWNDLEPYSATQRRVFARQERWGLQHADAVTVASRALEALAWSLGVPPAKVTYLPNAIERSDGAVMVPAEGSRFAESPGPAKMRGLAEHDFTEPGRPPTLLLYTRFFEFEIERPLDVLERVRMAWPSTRLVVAGTGLFGEERDFEDAARARGLDEAVELRGWVEPRAAAALFAEADVALYPFDDTLINRTKSAFKLIELMQAGLPVVAEAVGQNAEVIEDGRSGRLVAPGDVDAFAGAIGELLGSPERRRAMGCAARARVETAFNWERQVVALEAVYRRALAP